MFGILLRLGASMKSLPFVVKPKRTFSKVQIGNEKSGIIEIEKRGYLTVSEKTFVDSVTQGSDAVSLIVALATRISSALDESVEACYVSIMKAIQNNLDDDELARRIKADYSKELGDVIAQLGDSMQKRAIAAATVLIQSRIDSEWTLEDTLNQDPALLAAFSDFYQSEELGDIEPEPSEKKSETEQAAELVGKSTEENGEK